MERWMPGFQNIKRNSMFNAETANIFTDGSFRVKRGAAYGAILNYMNRNLIEDIRPYQSHLQTINKMELKAILLAVGMAMVIPGYIIPNKISYINIFTDSKYALDAVKKYMFAEAAWYWDPNKKRYKKTTGNYQFWNMFQKQEVTNQDLIIEICNAILKFQAMRPDIILELYWCPAHVKESNNRQILNSTKKFKEVNVETNYRNSVEIDTGFMREVCRNNDYVDRKVRDASARYKKGSPEKIAPIEFDISPEGLKKR